MSLDLLPLLTSIVYYANEKIENSNNHPVDTLSSAKFTMFKCLKIDK